MAVITQRPCEADGQRDIPQPSPFRRRHVPVPARPLDAQLADRQVDVVPFQRDHLPAPQAGLTAQEDGQSGVSPVARAASTNRS